MTQECHTRARAAGQAGLRPRPRAVAVAMAGRRAGVARFCHLFHIITGVSLLYGGGELITPVTVSPYL